MAWIRSQNKEILEDVNMVQLVQLSGIKSYGTAFGHILKSDSGSVLGKFSNKEGALRELDKIAEWIGGQGSYIKEIFYDPEKEKITVRNKVYQIGEES